MLSRARDKNKITKNKYTRISLLALLVLVSFSYVWQISQVSTQGYRLKDLERQVADLEKINEQLGTEEASLKSLTRIEARVAELGMVKNSSITYLSSESEDAVALKQ